MKPLHRWIGLRRALAAAIISGLCISLATPISAAARPATDTRPQLSLSTFDPYDISIGVTEPGLVTPVHAGDTILFRITAHNDSTSMLATDSGLPVLISYSSGLTLDPDHTLDPAYDTSSGYWNYPSPIDPGFDGTLDLYLKVNSDQAGTSQQVSADFTAIDVDPTNNYAESTIDIAALFTFDPSDVIFISPSYPVGATSPSATVKVTNDQAGAQVDFGTITADAGFLVPAASDHCSGQTIPSSSPDNTCTFDVQFHPTEVKSYSAYVDVPLTGGLSQKLSVHGTAVAGGGLTFDSTSLDLGDQLVSTTGPATLLQHVTNELPIDITVGTLTISTGFQLGFNDCNSKLLQQGDSCSFAVSFKPASVGSWTGQVTIPSSPAPSVNNSDSVSLSGNGVAGTQLLTNTSFETANKYHVPTRWQKGGAWGLNDGFTTSKHRLGLASVTLTGATGLNGSAVLKSLIFKRGQLTGVAGDDFVLNVWSRVASVPSTALDRAVVKFLNGTVLSCSQTINLKKNTLRFINTKLAFTVPCAYTNIQLVLQYKATSGSVWLDDVSLVWAP